jgi:hypothetical protein
VSRKLNKGENMPKMPEPKFVVKYVKQDLPIDIVKANYEKFLKHLVRVVKEQEAIEASKKEKNET